MLLEKVYIFFFIRISLRFVFVDIVVVFNRVKFYDINGYIVVVVLNGVNFYEISGSNIFKSFKSVIFVILVSMKSFIVFFFVKGILVVSKVGDVFIVF